MNDLIGKLISHYKIIEQVGQGGPVRRNKFVIIIEDPI